MGIEPFLIASTVRAVVAQRLVRKLVPENTEIYHPDDATIKRIQAAFGLNSQEEMDRIHKLEMQFIQSGLEGVLNSTKVIANAEPSIKKDGITRLWRMKGQTGAASFKGRLGVYEVLPVTPTIQKHIISGATSETIQQEAIKEGMVTMQTDGLVKALQGQTTLEEIMRVTSEQ
jgi:type II secretory ATPase GspE/PulE/Tfp pilus assembly ATPase PilB-like protein